jgi:hypothetical protein
MSEQMRKEFEEWAEDKDYCLDTLFFSGVNSYKSADTFVAYEIWQASRAALCVVLPDVIEIAGEDCWITESMNPCEVRDAIHAAGVKTK